MINAATIPDPSLDGPRITAVTRLSLSNFRCYGELRLEVEARPIVLIGPNGSGKTNLLEALSFLAPGRGLRQARLSEPDRRPGGAAASLGAWAVAARVTSRRRVVAVGTGHEVAAGGEASGRRIVKIDGAVVRGQKDLAEIASVVWLTPEMDRLFDDGASARRRFLDRLVFSFDPEHAGRLAAYEHRLRERARLLAEGAGDAAWLEALEDGMARHGVAIAAARANVVMRLSRAADMARGPFPSAALSLHGDVDGWLRETPALAVEDRLRAALAAARRQDAEQGAAAHGPHRSDLVVRFAARNQLAAACSTGEQKALLLSILLAHARELAAERGTTPILLLDEVVAHLDRARRAALFGEISDLGAQAWLSGTDEELFQALGGKAQMFRVFDATVMPLPGGGG